LQDPCFDLKSTYMMMTKAREAKVREAKEREAIMSPKDEIK